MTIPLALCTCGETSITHTFAIYEGMLLYRVNFLNRTSFTIPIGNGSLDKAMEALKAYCKENGVPPWFCTVPKVALPILLDNYQGTIPAPSRDWADYLYNAEDLAYGR